MNVGITTEHFSDDTNGFFDAKSDSSDGSRSTSCYRSTREYLSIATA